MQPGFAFLESGLIRSTNTINVLFKNIIDVSLGGFFFFLVGYSLMWNTEGVSGFAGGLSFGWLLAESTPTGILPQVHFLFQFAFAMTAATICSGAVAGRIQLAGYLVVAIVLSTFIYPISGYWAWADTGWLQGEGLWGITFHDYAGSAVVHAVGGFAALAGAQTLGSRIAKFQPDDKRLTDSPKAILLSEAQYIGYSQAVNRPHNIPLATLGVFFLWIGWFGFNGGSGLAIAGEQGKVGQILLNTLLSACMGGVVATLSSSIVNGKSEKKFFQIDIESTLNGILGGLVIITAGCDLITDPRWALFLGACAGFLVVTTVIILHHLEIDDPVGAFAVHGVCGVVGTIACSFFLPNIGMQLAVQAIGLIAICSWSYFISLLLFKFLSNYDLLRVNHDDEILGLDAKYHGKPGYRIED